MLPEAGAVTVAANFRLMYDKRSELQTNNAFVTGLRRAEKQALQIATEADAKLVKEHEALVQRLNGVRKRADTELKNSAKQTQQFLVNSRREAVASMMRTMAPPAYKSKSLEQMMGMGDTSKFKQTLNRIEGHMNAFHQRMKSRGLMAGDASFEEEFLVMGTKERMAAQRELSRFIEEADFEEKEDKLLLLNLVRDLESATDQRTIAESKHRNIHRQSNAEEQQSLRKTRVRIQENNQARLQAIGLLRQHMQATQSLTMAIDMGLRQALMQSGIVLMTLGFRLNQVIESFKEFERELMNAQSIFQTTQETLFGLSDQVAQFGTQFGININQAAEGLYQLASAGLSATESQEVLTNTLKLSMAVQGDHNTISKLTTQTIFGFGLEMSDSAALTDKFAHAINKSLIEYQDLASAVKFAMPFFVSTGQNIDQLLGSLQVLTNRALEAGIAGRGLRQALAEFAQHAEDNEAAFRKMGVEIMDAEGNFKMLTEIAEEFRTAIGPAAGDVELMTTLLQDLNVRGATAFVHLVQNVDEFKGAVNDLQNSAGSATEMAEIQQKSLFNQIQRIKNALLAPFLLSDEVGKANGVLNEFGLTLHTMVGQFEDFFVIRMADGTTKLTEFGEAIKKFVIVSLQELSTLVMTFLEGIRNVAGEGKGLISVFKALLIPINAFANIFRVLPEGLLETAIMFRLMNQLLPTNIILQIAETQAMLALAQVNGTLSASMMNTVKAMFLIQGAMFASILIMNKMGESGAQLVPVIMALAGAVYAYQMASSLMTTNPLAFALSLGAGVAGGALIGKVFADISRTPSFDYTPVTMDNGGMILPMYDNGGRIGPRHFPVMVEPGETIIPKTQNMLSGSGGITLNIQGDIVTNDADDFAERIAIALPEALRNINDVGGI